MTNHIANNNYCFHNNDHHITKNKFTIFDCNLDMNHLSNNSSMISSMNLCMYNMMDHIIDNYIKYYNILKNNFLKKSRNSKCNRDCYQLLNSSNMNYYFNFNNLNMLIHMANNNCYLYNNHFHTITNMFTNFD